MKKIQYKNISKNQMFSSLNSKIWSIFRFLTFVTISFICFYFDQEFYYNCHKLECRCTFQFRIGI